MQAFIVKKRRANIKKACTQHETQLMLHLLIYLLLYKTTHHNHLDHHRCLPLLTLKIERKKNQHLNKLQEVYIYTTNLYLYNKQAFLMNCRMM